MAGIEPNVAALVLFGVTFAACCFAFFTMIGMVPLAARPAALAGAPGLGLIAVNMVLLAALVIVVLLFAHDTLRWTSIVVLGGLIFLFTPSLFQVVPAAWRDSRGGLVALGALQMAALVVILAPHVMTT